MMRGFKVSCIIEKSIYFRSIAKESDVDLVICVERGCLEVGSGRDSLEIFHEASFRLKSNLAQAFYDCRYLQTEGRIEKQFINFYNSSLQEDNHHHHSSVLFFTIRVSIF